MNNVVGKIFGRLKVLSLEKRVKHHTYYRCQCKCGKIKVVRFSSLWNHLTKSCGCLQKDKAIKTCKSRKLPFSVCPTNTLFGLYKSGARKRNLTFDLSKEDFEYLIKQNCHYCGSKPQTKYASYHNKKDFIIYNGIDRVDNFVGYVKNNCVSCCEFCNASKSNYTKEEFLNKIKMICQHSNL